MTQWSPIVGISRREDLLPGSSSDITVPSLSLLSSAFCISTMLCWSSRRHALIALHWLWWHHLRHLPVPVAHCPLLEAMVLVRTGSIRPLLRRVASHLGILLLVHHLAPLSGDGVHHLLTVMALLRILVHHHGCTTTRTWVPILLREGVTRTGRVHLHLHLWIVVLWISHIGSTRLLLHHSRGSELTVLSVHELRRALILAHLHLALIRLSAKVWLLTIGHLSLIDHR
jgi:hypothetical protein